MKKQKPNISNILIYTNFKTVESIFRDTPGINMGFDEYRDLSREARTDEEVSCLCIGRSKKREMVNFVFVMKTERPVLKKTIKINPF